MAAEDKIAERIVALETRMEGLQVQFAHFQTQMASNQSAILTRLDKIDGALDKRREKVDAKIAELNQRTPAILQTIVQGLVMGGAMALVYYFLGRIP